MEEEMRRKIENMRRVIENMNEDEDEYVVDNTSDETL